ncbi:MAG: hypothetical protein HQK82_08260 [Desulfovibrionaceae bacterium]|nr:hypothetical protein [Desulfovibrionaceae bacterium]
MKYLKHICPLNINVYYTLGFGESVLKAKKLKEKYIKILRENVIKEFPNSHHVWRLEPRLSDGEPHLHVLASVKDSEGNYINEKFCDWMIALWKRHVDECDAGFEDPVDCIPATDSNVKKYTSKKTEDKAENNEIPWDSLIMDYWKNDAKNRWGYFPKNNYQHFAVGPRGICLNEKEFFSFLKKCEEIKENQILIDRNNGYNTANQEYYKKNLKNKPDNVMFCLTKDDVEKLEKHLFKNATMFKKMLF